MKFVSDDQDDAEETPALQITVTNRISATLGGTVNKLSSFNNFHFQRPIQGIPTVGKGSVQMTSSLW
jgi:hypothetical protein